MPTENKPLVRPDGLARRLALLSATLTVFAACAASTGGPPRQSQGLWDGMLHGLFAPLNVVRSWFGSVGICDFDVGFLYDAGFVLGFGMCGALVSNVLGETTGYLIRGRSTRQGQLKLVAATVVVGVSTVMALVLANRGAMSPPVPDVTKASHLLGFLSASVRYSFIQIGSVITALSACLALFAAPVAVVHSLRRR